MAQQNDNQEISTLDGSGILAKSGLACSRLFRRKAGHRLFIFPPADILTQGGDWSLFAREFNSFRPLYIHTNTMTASCHVPATTIKNSFMLGVFAGVINRSANAIVLGGKNKAFYQIIPLLLPGVKKIEWCVETSDERKALEWIALFDWRVLNTHHLLLETKKLYAANEINDMYSRRLIFIEDAFDADLPIARVKGVEVLHVLCYFESGVDESHRLIANIATLALKNRLPIKFQLAGHSPDFHLANCERKPASPGDGTLLPVMQEADVLLMISPSSSNSILLKRMMKLGKVVVATAADYVPDYISDGSNGYLIPASADDGKIAEDCFIALSILSKDKLTYNEMSRAASESANRIFDSRAIMQDWASVISSTFNRQA